MKHMKKLLPAWLVIIIDIGLIAVYTVGFYGLYYLTPRQLNSSGIKTLQENTATASENIMGSSQAADTTESSTASDTAGTLTAPDTQENSAPSGTSEAAGITDTQSQNSSDFSDNYDSSGTSDAPVPSGTDGNSTAAADSTSASSVPSEDLAAKFADHFTDKVVSTDNSYSSSDISVTVNKYTESSDNNLVTYYVADIYVADIKSLQSGFADNTYGVGYTDSVLDMDEAFNSILTMNGDYYGNGGNGVVIRNGEVYRSTTNGSDVCVLYYNGVMKTFSAQEFDVDQAIKDGAWQAWSFGPGLLDENGNSKSGFTADGHVQDINPRSAIGYYEPGHYCLVVVDGRQRGYSYGMTLTQLSELFNKLGCKAAYNLDGGKSSVMTFNDALVNQPTQGGREVSDCIIIKETD